MFNFLLKPAMKTYFIYITTNPRRTVLYTGVTNDLEQRIFQHFENRGNRKTFAGRYFCYQLIYYEDFGDINDAIEREKEIKNMSREMKEELIKTKNPRWITLKV
jgi:putative endonuclease